jgi:hypothetical protein
MEQVVQVVHQELVEAQEHQVHQELAEAQVLQEPQVLVLQDPKEHKVQRDLKELKEP